MWRERAQQAAPLRLTLPVGALLAAPTRLTPRKQIKSRRYRKHPFDTFRSLGLKHGTADQGLPHLLEAFTVRQLTVSPHADAVDQRLGRQSRLQPDRPEQLLADSQYFRNAVGDFTFD